MTYKVIADNGYKIELLRPLRDAPLDPGTRVDLEVQKKVSDLVNLFDNLLDDETRQLLMDAKVKETA